MAGVAPVEAGSALAQTIQSVVQPKLMENGWVAEENDTTLSEYVTMMIVNGKDLRSVQSELGGDLLGVGEDDPAVGAFAEWLFERVRALAATTQQKSGDGTKVEAQVQNVIETPSAMDSQMEDATPVEGVPRGPKAMRGGAAGRGRDKRMLGQMNNHMNRHELPDPLKRIKGAAAGQGRINTHSNRDPPRGPRNQNLANGVQRVMNNGARGGHHGILGGHMNPTMQQQGHMMNQFNSDQQLAVMQMMEMQANLMTQMMGVQMPPVPGIQQNPSGKSLFERVEKKPNGHFKGRPPRQEDGQQNGEAASGMELDSEGKRKEPFETICRFNINCTNPTCPYAHQSPSAPPGQTVDMSDTCAFGVACENRKCVGKHPSPAQRTQHLKQEVDCKFYPNCTNPGCPFKHPDMPLCRNGADCNVTGCKFTHSKIMCRYTPCQRPFCPFKHVEGQRGVFKDKVWTKDGVPDDDGTGGDTIEDDKSKANRFAGFKENETQAEELIIPGQPSKQDASEDNNFQMQSQADIVS